MKNIFLPVFLLIVVSMILVACQQTVQTSLSEEDKTTIRNAAEKAVELGNAEDRDFTAYVQHYYAEDATVMAPNMPAVTGQAELISFFDSYPPYEDMDLQIENIEGSGDLAYVRGTYSMTLIEGNTTLEDTGKYIEVWKQQDDGDWKVYLDMFNSNIPSDTLTEENKNVVRQFHRDLDEAGVKEAVERHTARSLVVHHPRGLVSEPMGSEEYVAAGSQWQTSFPDLRHTIDAIVAEGDQVWVQLTDYGTHEGEHLGIPATGKEIEFTVMSRFRMQDGKIAEVWMQADTLGLLQQLGAESIPPANENKTE